MEKLTKTSFSQKRWAVIGSGAAGVTFLSALLSQKVEPQDILWLDESFEGGALARYGDVPGNTQVAGFINWATSNPCMQRLASHGSLPLAELQVLNPARSCRLEAVHRLVMNYTGQLQAEVCWAKGRVQRLEFDEPAGLWSITLEGSEKGTLGDKFLATNVCMATGCYPTLPTNLHFLNEKAVVLPLEACYSHKFLVDEIKEGMTVGVVGGSHSAFVIMYLLEQLNLPNLKVINFYRGEIRFAEYKDGFILYDNTGLKGEVAEWAAKAIKGDTKPGFQLERVCIGKDERLLHEKAKACDRFVYGHGYVRRTIPEILYRLPEAVGYDDKVDILPNIARFVSHSNLNGNIMITSNTNGEVSVKGLYGFGFAFPEKVVTRIGEVEQNVGIMKFSKCCAKWIQSIDV